MILENIRSLIALLIIIWNSLPTSLYCSWRWLCWFTNWHFLMFQDAKYDYTTRSTLSILEGDRSEYDIESCWKVVASSVLYGHSWAMRLSTSLTWHRLDFLLQYLNKYYYENCQSRSISTVYRHVTMVSVVDLIWDASVGLLWKKRFTYRPLWWRRLKTSSTFFRKIVWPCAHFQ